MDKTMFGGRSLFYSALSCAEGWRLDSIETEVLCPGDRWSPSNEPFPPFLFPLFTPNRLCRRVLSLPQRAVRAAGLGERTSTDMAPSAALRWLAKWSARSFLSRSFPCRSSRFCFSAEACAASYLGRAVLLAEGQPRGDGSDPALGSALSQIPPFLLLSLLS